MRAYLPYRFHTNRVRTMSIDCVHGVQSVLDRIYAEFVS